MPKPSWFNFQTADPFAIARRRMIEAQLLPRNISNPDVLEALWQIPRHLFVPPTQLTRAYDDAALPSLEGQTISQPYMVAKMTEELDLHPGQHVLEIGTGTGYQTAILSHLVSPTGKIYTIERSPTLADSAKKILDQLHLTNIHYLTADGSQGWPNNQIQFDRILVTAGSPAIPEPLLAQLKNTGIMIAPIGPEDCQTLYRITRHQNQIEQTPLFDCRFVPLIGNHAWPQKD